MENRLTIYCRQDEECVSCYHWTEKQLTNFFREKGVPKGILKMILIDTGRLSLDRGVAVRAMRYQCRFDADILSLIRAAGRFDMLIHDDLWELYRLAKFYEKEGYFPYGIAF